MRPALLALAAGACLALSAILGGTDPVGRVLLGLGLPGAALPFLSDPGWEGVAAYRAGRHDRAAAAFARSDDPSRWLGGGNAEVLAGRYAAALEAFDQGRAAGDADAAANFDLIAAFYAGLALDPETPVSWFAREEDDGPTAAAPVGLGNARAAGTGDDVTNAGTLLGLPELESTGRLGVRKVFDDKFVVASRRWLATLSDVPGDYLAERIEFERRRRAELGLAPPEPEDPR